MAFGRTKADEAADQGTDPRLAAVQDQAHTAKLARLPVLAVVLDMPAELWGLAVHQVEQHGYALAHWSVDQGVAHPLFRRTG
jgi:hypothetical protein